VTFVEGFCLAIRTTNVYHENAMGVYDDGESIDSLEIEADFERRKTIGSYLAFHARKQLAFDLWWIWLAIFVSECTSRHRCLP
jgi:hypothetical protein